MVKKIHARQEILSSNPTQPLLLKTTSLRHRFFYLVLMTMTITSLRHRFFYLVLITMTIGLDFRVLVLS